MVLKLPFVHPPHPPLPPPPHHKKIGEQDPPNVFFSKHLDMEEKPLTKQRENLEGNASTGSQSWEIKFYAQTLMISPNLPLPRQSQVVEI